jgi:hypothetical protein
MGGRLLRGTPSTIILVVTEAEAAEGEEESQWKTAMK